MEPKEQMEILVEPVLALRTPALPPASYLCLTSPTFPHRHRIGLPFAGMADMPVSLLSVTSYLYCYSFLPGFPSPPLSSSYALQSTRDIFSSWMENLIMLFLN